MAASTEGYRHRADAIKNLHDAAGIAVGVRGRESRYRWIVWRSGAGLTTASALP